MCTVVYIPGDEKIIFASLRDENPKRQTAIAPQLYSHDTISFLAPKDPVAGGTWLGVNSAENVIILLNGGFENHQKKEVYRKSRGLMVTELLSKEMPVAEWGLINMQDVEPFTLIVWSENNLFQLVWDGTNPHKIELDTEQAYIWSSATLYSESIKENRESLFQQWIATKPLLTKQSLLSFFHTYSDAENGFIMNRNEITKTLSYTFVELIKNEQATMNYVDSVNSSTSNYKVSVISFMHEKIPG
jgi:uncharacterized protein with NRDE domain